MRNPDRLEAPLRTLELHLIFPVMFSIALNIYETFCPYQLASLTAASLPLDAGKQTTENLNLYLSHESSCMGLW